MRRKRIKMPVEYICDGCGKREPSPRNVINFGWVKPEGWYGRTDAETGKSYVACSRKCIDAIEENTGETNIIAPW